MFDLETLVGPHDNEDAFIGVEDAADMALTNVMLDEYDEDMALMILTGDERAFHDLSDLDATYEDQRVLVELS